MENKKNKLLTNASDIIDEILSIKEGLIKYTDVKLIKIKSERYQLTIMKDYVPLIGDIDGEIEIVQKDGKVQLKDITGFYIHKRNEFKLFLKEESKA